MTNISKIEADLYARGINFVHITPDDKSAQRAKANFHKVLSENKLPIPENKWEYTFVSCKIQGVAIDHKSVVIFENWDKLDKRAREEALTIPGWIDGMEPVVMYVNP